MSNVGSYLRVKLTLDAVEPIPETRNRFKAHLERSKLSAEGLDVYITGVDGMWVGGRANSSQAECQAFADGWLNGFFAHKDRVRGHGDRD